METKIKVLIFILLIIVFFVGFMFGSYVTIKAVANIAGGFLNEELVTKALYQYKNNIGGCYPSLLNASFYNYSGN